MRRTPAFITTKFQSTLPRGERRGMPGTPLWTCLFQSTLPRGERLGSFFNSRLQKYFNPRSRVGSDTRVKSREGGYTYFNPRSRVGSDRIIQASLCAQSISIHAPAWGATPSGFNTRIHSRFQSTLPRGERHTLPFFYHCNLTNFNPRSRVGSDIFHLSQSSDGFLISIHAPAWGATLHRFDPHHTAQFQSTLPRGERPCRSRNR